MSIILRNVVSEKIILLEKENSFITKKNEELEYQSEQLKTKIRELEIKIELVKKETEEEKAMFMERDLLNRIKFEELESKYSEIQKKAFSMQQEKQKKNKNRLYTGEKTSYRMKKMKKHHEIDKSGILSDYHNLNQDNQRMEKSITEKAAYLNELINKIKTMGEKQVLEPSYLRSKTKRK